MDNNVNNTTIYTLTLRKEVYDYKSLQAAGEKRVEVHEKVIQIAKDLGVEKMCYKISYCDKNIKYKASVNYSMIPSENKHSRKLFLLEQEVTGCELELGVGIMSKEKQKKIKSNLPTIKCLWQMETTKCPLEHKELDPFETNPYPFHVKIDWKV